MEFDRSYGASFGLRPLSETREMRGQYIHYPALIFEPQ